jgi:hypothetical protein
MNAWEDTVRAIGQFPDAVLTVTDSAGYPTSVRCSPEVVTAARVLRVQPPAWLDVQPGPASLMSHSHDEQLWNLRSFHARGTVEASDGALLFRPTACAWTAGSGIRSTLQLLLGTRRAAARYLRRRGLNRPRVPWATIKAAKTALHQTGRGSG